ncbi:MAG: hypothetical protein IJZ61_02115 [Oscillospiraceae bacterium]|nr:hypothetical protein [Oscillospiraceae bacterium]
MKKLSLFKKIRLAFMAEGWMVKLIIMFYPLMMFATIFDDESFLRIMGMVCFGLIVGSMSFVYMSMPAGNLKMYKVMPMRTADIVDVMSVHTLLGAILIAVPYIILLPLAGKADLLPYFLCVDFACLAITSTAVIWYAKDKYAYAQAKDRTGDEADIKKNTRRAMWTAFGYMFVEGAIGFIILFQSIDSELSADAPWLIAVSAVALIIYTAVALGARKIKNAFIY